MRYSTSLRLYQARGSSDYCATEDTRHSNLGLITDRSPFTGSHLLSVNMSSSTPSCSRFCHLERRGYISVVLEGSRVEVTGGNAAQTVPVSHALM